MESSQKSARLNSNLPEDLWPEILLRLPMKSVCRFRAVCKSWNSLIPSPFFVNLRDSFTRSIASSSKLFNLKDDVPFPFRFIKEAGGLDLYEISVVDVVHGVVCVSYTMDSSYDTTILWNPAVHKYLSLPRLPFPSRIDSAVSGYVQVDPDPAAPALVARFMSTAIGFGYDRYTDEFKVVRVWMSCEYIESRCGFIPTTYDVYSTRRAQWNKAATAKSLLKSVTVCGHRPARGCFVNGTICWVGMSLDLQKHCVIIFDCRSDELTMVDFPQEIYEPEIYTHNAVRVAEVLEYGGMLAVLVDRRWDLIELWGMKQLGPPATTWHKLITIDNPYGLRRSRPWFLMQVPHGPKQWIKFHDHVDSYHQEYVYVESMFLIGESKAKPYTDNETVHISIPVSPFDLVN